MSPFDSFDSSGASVTLTGLAVTDIEVYKNGGTTQRASDSGYSLLDTDGIDFDSLTGIHGFSIDLADNTTAGFWEAGADYRVVVSSVTIDGQTVSFTAATFRIGYPGALLDTKIATLASQTSFTLSAGSADNDAYNGWVAVIHDVASAVQIAVGYVSDYVGSTKTVTLAADPGIFTMAAGDNISLFPPAQVASWNAVPLATTNPLPNAAADAAGGLPISDAGGLNMDGLATASALATVDSNVDAILVDTAEIGAAGAGLTAVPWNAAWDAEVQSECTDALNAYDPPTKAETDALLTTAMTESYAANGAAPTPAQALMAIHQMLMQFAINDTSVTVKKLDNSTTAFVVTLDDGTSPTSAVRT